jgi:hypothetical protein
MKKLFLLLMVTGLYTGITACAQAPSPGASVSETTASGVKISIDYSSPGVKGRKIFAPKSEKALQPYGEIWRTGANDITKLTFSKAVTLGGKSVAAGSYGLFAIPGEKEWTIIISKKSTGSGATYPEGEDLFRFKVTPKKAPMTERLVYKISKAGVITLTWETTEIDIPVK